MQNILIEPIYLKLFDMKFSSIMVHKCDKIS